MNYPGSFRITIFLSKITKAYYLVVTQNQKCKVVNKSFIVAYLVSIMVEWLDNN